MDNTQIILLVVVIFVALVAAKMVYDGIARKKKIDRQIRREFGSLPDNDYTAPRYDKDGIAWYYKNKEKTTPVIDDITWNDLDMDTVYMILNNTSTGIGEEYLYAMLRMPCMDDVQLKERDRIAQYFDSHEKERVSIMRELKKLGKLRMSSVGQYLSAIRSMRPHNPTFHVACCLLMILCVVGCIVDVNRFLMPLLLMFAVNISTYFSYRGKISSYFVVFSYLARMTQTAANVADVDCDGIARYNEELKTCVKPLKKISRFAWLFVSGTDFSADLIALVLDYLKIITHIDLIIFDRMVYNIYTYRNELDRIIDIMGEIDSDLAIASYRRYMGGQVCTPELRSEGPLSIKTENIYHPMIINPVKNTLDEDRSVLLTGSNASGKSTFLKTIAINAIFAQTIYTCLADRYESPFFRVYSSMALQDNIQGNESYYIVEIKSLKRIVDAAGGALTADGAEVYADNDGGPDDAAVADAVIGAGTMGAGAADAGSASHGASARNDAGDCAAPDPDTAYAHVPVLCFIDEVLRGTNTVERIAASSRILHALAHKNALCFAATHDIELTTILEQTYANYHFQEEVDDHDVTFDYLLYKGRATSRNAIKLLGIIGFNEEIITEATSAARDFEDSGAWAAMK